jgi:hypothetical protein
MFDRLLLSPPTEGVRRVLLAAAVLRVAPLWEGSVPIAARLRVGAAVNAYEALNDAVSDARFRRQTAEWAAEGDFAPWETEWHEYRALPPVGEFVPWRELP